MTTYKSYAEAKIANPDSEIVTTGKNWKWSKKAIGTFVACISGVANNHTQDGWVICNPSDHCSSLKEFLDAGFKLVKGDAYVEVSGKCKVINNENSPFVNSSWKNDCDRYILSAAALNGGCKIPAKADQWNVYNNTLPLSELSDEQAAQLFNAWRNNGSIMCRHYTDKMFVDIEDVRWADSFVYRTKQKSERELFIEQTTKVMRNAGTKCPDNHEYFGIMFDAGARYTDHTQHFGESI